MNYQGLLLNRQKGKGYFTMGDEDFVFVFHRDQGKPMAIAIFSTYVTTIKQIRDAVDAEIKRLRMTDIWEWLKEKRQEIRKLLKENGIKDFHRTESLVNGIEGLMFEAFQLGKEYQKEHPDKMPNL
jgi:hypothetical protein